jgi:hypothetical protein
MDACVAKDDTAARRRWQRTELWTPGRASVGPAVLVALPKEVKGVGAKGRWQPKSHHLSKLQRALPRQDHCLRAPGPCRGQLSRSPWTFPRSRARQA